MRRKGQVTIFIIIGIIMLLALAIFLGLQSRTAQESAETAIEDALRDQNPIYGFTEECLQQTGLRALKRAGEQGGFTLIRPPYFVLNDEKPYLGDAIPITEDLRVPYWTHIATPTPCLQCVYENSVPSIDVIEQELAAYVREHVNECLEDFNIFVKEGYIIESEKPQVEFTISENTVNMKSEYPIKATLGERTFETAEFITIYDLPLRHFIAQATQIALAQQDQQFLERAGLQAISTYAGKPSRERIPPIYWFDHSNKIVTWQESDVRERIRNSVLGSSLNLLQVNGSKNYKHLTSQDPSEQQYYNGLVVNTAKPDDSISIDFHFDPDWNIYLDITPRQGKVFSPSTYSTSYLFGLVPSSQDNYYEFFYDVSYPVLVSLHSDDVLQEHTTEGYTFLFGLEGNIIDNKNPLQWNQGQGTMGVTSYEDTPFTINLPQEEQQECEEIQGKTRIIGGVPAGTETLYRCTSSGKTYSTEVECALSCREERLVSEELVTTESLFCDYAQRLSGEQTTYTFDAYTQEPVPDVQVIFGCANFQRCLLGNTGPKGLLASQLPVCLGDGGYFLYSRKGYIADPTENVTTQIGIAQDFDVPLYRIAYRNATVKYINITNLYIYKRFLEPYVDGLIEHEEAVIEAVLKNSVGLSDKIREGLVDTVSEAGKTFTAMHTFQSPEQQEDAGDNWQNKPRIAAETAARAVGDALVAMENIVFKALPAITAIQSSVVGGTLLEDELKKYFTVQEQEAITEEFEERHSLLLFIQADLKERARYGQWDEGDAQVLRLYAQTLMSDMEYFQEDAYIEQVSSIIGRDDYDKSIFNGLYKNFTQNRTTIETSLQNVHFLTADQLRDTRVIDQYRFDAKELDGEQSAVVTIARETPSDLSPRLPKIMAQVRARAQGELSFIPSDYISAIHLLSDEAITIPSSNITAYNFSTTIPEQVLGPPAPIGGAIFDDNNTFSVGLDLYDSDSITFYVFKYDTPQVAEDAAEISKALEYTRKFKDVLYPELK